MEILRINAHRGSRFSGPYFEIRKWRKIFVLITNIREIAELFSYYGPNSKEKAKIKLQGQGSNYRE